MMQSIFQQQTTDRLSSEAIVDCFSKDNDGASVGARLTQAQLARRLAPFGIRPTIVHRTRTQVRRGYRREDFADAFARYLSK
jgi:hypothetical protein